MTTLDPPLLICLDTTDNSTHSLGWAYPQHDQTNQQTQEKQQSTFWFMENFTLLCNEAYSVVACILFNL